MIDTMVDAMIDTMVDTMVDTMINDRRARELAAPHLLLFVARESMHAPHVMDTRRALLMHA